ncbi:MAG: DNA-binding transcriptional regulator [Chloroflexi bacterium HGW-Chloroflexi-3]|nr:MAG: DNA-binding transcriptional regulator [Chloroflexi bacterium HGW-Chloroflexi-3]
MARIDELRMIARVARMYYELDKRQSDIAEQLGLSQSTVSRLLSRSKEEGIIRFSINMPQGVYTELEESLVMKYNLRDAVVVDCLDEDENLIQRDLGAVASYYLETIIRPNEVIGISSWSATLLALVDSLQPLHRKMGIKVVQILGGVGNPAVEAHATHLTSRMAQLLNGEAIYLPVPGVLATEAARSILIADDVSQKAIKLFDHVTTALVGIGAIDPSPLLAQSGNIFSARELDLLRQKKAIGDILLHFFDEDGNLVDTGIDNRVISLRLEQLIKVNRAIGVAGGLRKFKGIQGALRGRWINILITDRFTAGRLLAE